MNKTLFAFSFLIGACLYAENTNDCCSPDPCCSPPCTPLQKECVDCVCFTPQYYDLQCAWGVFVSVDFLYWYAKETGLYYALEAESVETFAGSSMNDFVHIVPRKYHPIDESWDPGFRVGIGLNSCCDGWDIYANWTYFHTKEKAKTLTAQPNQVDPEFPLGKSLFSPWDIPIGIIPTTPNNLTYYDQISAKWKIDFNVIDLELGRNYWLSKCFSLRPYMGLRGGWTRTRFNTTVTLQVPENSFIFINSSDISFKNRFWGVGLLGGIQPNWHLGCGFSIYGNADFSLLWGCFDIKRNQTISLDDGTDVFNGSFGESKNEFSSMQAILDLALGFRWESTYCCERYRLAIDLGWEHHQWFNHNHRFQIRGDFIMLLDSGQLGQSFEDFDETYGDLSLGGLVARLRFDF